MGRIRTIKPDVARHEGLFQLEQETGLPIRFAWAVLPTVCDREGRFKWRPNVLKLDILPFDDCDFSRVLDAWATRGQVVKYRVGDAWFGLIPTWAKHQVVNNKEKPSDIPPLDDADEVYSPNNQAVPNACATRGPRVNDASPEVLGKDQGEGKGREGEKEGKGKGKDVQSSCRSTPSSDVQEVFDHWKQVHNHPRAQLDEKRRKVIQRALKSYSLADLKLAIDGCKKSDFHQGKNDARTVYDSIQLILRDGDKIDSFIALAAKKPKGGEMLFEGVPVQWQ